MSALAFPKKPTTVHEVVIHLPASVLGYRQHIGYFAEETLAQRVAHFVRDLIDQRVEGVVNIECCPALFHPLDRPLIETQFRSKKIQDQVDFVVEHANKTMYKPHPSLDGFYGNVKWRGSDLTERSKSGN